MNTRAYAIVIVNTSGDTLVPAPPPDSSNLRAHSRSDLPVWPIWGVGPTTIRSASICKCHWTSGDSALPPNRALCRVVRSLPGRLHPRGEPLLAPRHCTTGYVQLDLVDKWRVTGITRDLEPLSRNYNYRTRVYITFWLADFIETPESTNQNVFYTTCIKFLDLGLCIFVKQLGLPWIECEQNISLE